MVGTDCRQKYLRSGKYVIYVDIISGIYIAGLLYSLQYSADQTQMEGAAYIQLSVLFYQLRKIHFVYPVWLSDNIHWRTAD